MIAWLLIPTGIYILLKADKIVDNFVGEVSFAVKIFGTGGTYTFIKLLGLLITIFSFMHITGGLEWFLGGTLGEIVPGMKPN